MLAGVTVSAVLLVVAAVLLALGIALLRAASALGSRRDDLRARGVRVAGRVVSGSAFGPTRTVEYPRPDGSTATLSVPATRPATLDPGQVVPVLVDPTDPDRAVVETAAQSSVPRILLTVWGVILLVASFGLFGAGVIGLAVS